MSRPLSVSIDAELITAVEGAVRAGHASSVSAFVEAALERQLEGRAQRLAAMDELIAWMDETSGPQSLEESRRIMREWRAEAIRPNAPS